MINQYRVRLLVTGDDLPPDVLRQLIERSLHALGLTARVETVEPTYSEGLDPNNLSAARATDPDAYLVAGPMLNPMPWDDTDAPSGWDRPWHVHTSVDVMHYHEHARGHGHAWSTVPKPVGR